MKRERDEITVTRADIDIGMVNEKGAGALHYMVKHPHCAKQINMIQKVLAAMPSLLFSTTNYGETPLHAACLKGNHKVLFLLRLTQCVQFLLIRP